MKPYRDSKEWMNGFGRYKRGLSDYGKISLRTWAWGWTKPSFDTGRVIKLRSRTSMKYLVEISSWNMRSCFYYDLTRYGS